MSGIDDIVGKIGDLFGLGVPKGGGKGLPSDRFDPNKKKGTSEQKGVTPKGFDINLYIIAWQNFFEDFFSKKIPMFFQDIGGYLKKFPDWFNMQKTEEQVCYVGVMVAPFLIIVGIVLMIVL